MCFRPADASMNAPGPQCPSCGRELQLPPGVIINKCPFCKHEFTEEDKAGMSAPIPGAPGVPGAPKAPGVPSAPKAPGAPKMPGL